MAQTKGRKQSLLLTKNYWAAPRLNTGMLRQMPLRQMQQRARFIALRRLQAQGQILKELKFQGEEVACGVVACNPDKGCESQAFSSCMAEVKQMPAKEKELLDMHRSEVLKLAMEHKDMLAVKQLSAQQCVVESCTGAGCNDDKFKGCIKQRVAAAEQSPKTGLRAMVHNMRAVTLLKLLHNKRALALRKLLAQRRAAFLKMSPEKRKAYLKALQAQRAKRLAAINARKGKAMQAKAKAPTGKQPYAKKMDADVKHAPTKQADVKKARASWDYAPFEAQPHWKCPDAHSVVNGKCVPAADSKGNEEAKKAKSPQSKLLAKKTVTAPEKAPKADAKQTVPKQADAKKSAPKKADASKVNVNL